RNNNLHRLPLKVQFNSKSNIGKLYIIRLLSTRLQELTFNNHPIIIRATPIKVAANNINESTLYSLLQLPITNNITILPDFTPNNRVNL
ncbi:hypothetical protein QBC45DRAFT_338241, partial [Copromyces sp. CBS 386.78]